MGALIIFDTLTKQAITHTLHCLTGCAIGEILGMVIGTALNWPNIPTTILAIILAFFFGYLLTVISLYRKNIKAKQAVKTAVATDTVSITSMETIDNLFIWLVPGAIHASLSSWLFWWSLTMSLLVAFVLTVPVNRWFIKRSPVLHHH